MNKTDLPYNLVEPTVTGLVQDPIVVTHLKNGLYMLNLFGEIH